MASTPAHPAPARARTGRAVAPFLGASLGAGGTAWLVLAGERRAAGALAAASGALLLAASSLVEEGAHPLLRFLGPAADRAFDGLILSAMAWHLHGRDPRAAALALVALSASFFAAYVRARGRGLGYGVEESTVNRALRYVLVAGGLLTGWVEGTLWALAVLTVLTTAVRASQVAKEERA